MMGRKFVIILATFLLALGASIYLGQQVQAAGLPMANAADQSVQTQPALASPLAAPFSMPLLDNTPALTITKTAQLDPVTAGNVLTYTLVVVNDTITDATGTIITDTLGSNVVFAGASDAYMHNAGSVTWDTGVISGGQTITRTLLVTVSAAYTGSSGAWSETARYEPS